MSVDLGSVIYLVFCVVVSLPSIFFGLAGAVPPLIKSDSQLLELMRIKCFVSVWLLHTYSVIDSSSLLNGSLSESLSL